MAKAETQKTEISNFKFQIPDSNLRFQISESRHSPAEISNSKFQISESGHAPPVTRHLLLDCPHYTRPADFRGWRVPEVLLSGNHEQIRRWRAAAALEKTRRNRPDLLREA